MKVITFHYNHGHLSLLWMSVTHLPMMTSWRFADFWPFLWQEPRNPSVTDGCPYKGSVIQNSFDNGHISLMKLLNNQLRYLRFEASWHIETACDDVDLGGCGDFTVTDLSSIVSLGKKLCLSRIKMQIFQSQGKFEMDICQMLVISSKGQWVNLRKYCVLNWVAKWAYRESYMPPLFTYTGRH